VSTTTSALELDSLGIFLIKEWGMGGLTCEELGPVLDQRRFHQIFLQILEPKMRVLSIYFF
jgi:hypothetical protein